MQVITEFSGNIILPKFLGQKCKIKGNTSTIIAKLLSLYLKTKETTYLISSKSFLPCMSSTSLSNNLNLLHKKKIIQVCEPYTYQEAFDILHNKNKYKGTCYLCGTDYVYGYDKHHFPIARCNGGTQTIKICPNCHRAFHNLTSFKRISILNFVNKYKSEIQDILECLDDELEGV